MQLIKKMFGRTPGERRGPGSESAQFHESDQSSASVSRNGPRRELVHVVLRDSMRRHGIPSAWIDCRILSVVTRSQRSGVHLQFIVRDGVDRLLAYVPAFQTSFMREIARFDPRVDDWLFSVSWQFLHFNEKVAGMMPDPAMWAGTTPGALLQPSATTAIQPPVSIAGSQQGATHTSTPRPSGEGAPVQPAMSGSGTPPSAGDEDVMEDLQALYAIRDASMRQGRSNSATGPAGEKDFESTRPGEAPAGPELPQPKRW